MNGASDNLSVFWFGSVDSSLPRAQSRTILHVWTGRPRLPFGPIIISVWSILTLGGDTNMSLVSTFSHCSEPQCVLVYDVSSMSWRFPHHIRSG